MIGYRDVLFKRCIEISSGGFCATLQRTLEVPWALQRIDCCGRWFTDPTDPRPITRLRQRSIWKRKNREAHLIKQYSE